MKTSIDLPDDRYRRVKARSALEQRTVREVTIELYQRWLAEPASAKQGDPESWLRSWLELADRALAGGPPGPTAREILENDRNRIERW